MNIPDVVPCNPVRTAVGTCGGTLKSIPAPDLGAAAMREGQGIALGLEMP